VLAPVSFGEAVSAPDDVPEPVEEPERFAAVPRTTTPDEKAERPRRARRI
jgi:hypothetical protein